MLTVVTGNEDTPAALVEGGSLIDEIVREGAADARRRVDVSRTPSRLRAAERLRSA